MAQSPLSLYVRMMGWGTLPAPARRDQALAFIIERMARREACPTEQEIGDRLKVSRSRARQLVAQLIAKGVVERRPGSQRNLAVRDVAQARMMLDASLRQERWIVADPLGELEAAPCPKAQLPILPPLQHVPDPD